MQEFCRSGTKAILLNLSRTSQTKYCPFNSLIPEMQDSPLPHGFLFIRENKSKTYPTAVARNSSSCQSLAGGAETKERAKK